MEPPLPAVDSDAAVEEVFTDLTAGGAAVLVAQSGKPAAVLTRSDLLEYLARGR